MPQLQEILRRSLMEMEVMHRQEELEQADLEAAVAMSLAVEEERVRQVKEQQQRDEKMSSSATLGNPYFLEERPMSKSADAKEANRIASPPSSPKQTDTSHYRSSSPESAKGGRSADRGAHLREFTGDEDEPAQTKSTYTPSPVAASPVAAVEQRPVRNEREEELYEPAQTKSSYTPVAAPEPARLVRIDREAESYDEHPTASQHKAEHVDDKEEVGEKGVLEFMDDGVHSRRAKAVLKPVGSKLNADAFAAPKPLQGRGLGGFNALPSIGAINDKRKQAEDDFRRAQEQLASGREQENSLRKQVEALGNDPNDAERRARHMAEQRDRLIAMKKAEREKRVQAEEERQAKLSADGDEMPEAVLRAKAEAHARSREAKNGGEEGDLHDPSNEDKRRGAMRLALARRMKLDLIESEDIKIAQMAEDQYADLDRKLQQVEQLRRDNKQREALMTEQIRRQQTTIARNVQRSAEELRREGPN